MRSAEPLITADSSYHNYESSRTARLYWLYPLCAGYFTYQKGYHLERASYDSWLLEVILDGEAIIQTKGKTYVAQAGDIVLLDCHKQHGYSSQTGWKALWVHFDGISAQGYADMIVPQNPVIRHPRAGEIVQSIQIIYDMLATPSPEKEADMALLLTQALTVLCRAAEEEKKDDRQAALRGIIARLNQRPGQEPSIAEMARQASLSEFHFIRAFARATGLTPRQYIIASRMNHAKYLLAHTGWTISVIADRVGYASESMFCLTFRKTQGMTPTEYRIGREKNEK